MIGHNISIVESQGIPPIPKSNRVEIIRLTGHKALVGTWQGPDDDGCALRCPQTLLLLWTSEAKPGT